MTVDLSKLQDEKRLLLTVPLRPVQGNRFQPTGFPDLGAATFNAPMLNGDSAACLLVESPQSMANRMELTIWDPGKNELKDFAKGMSYVRVVTEKGGHLTSSIEEAHRLNSVYIENANDQEFRNQLEKEMEYSAKNPINRKKFVNTVSKYDVNSLLHGVFLESIGGRLRVTRALSAFIEAEEVEVVASGGVKNDHVQPGTEKGSERTAAEGFGNVPYPREEYAAKKINAYFSLDISQIRGYGLEVDAEQLLILLGLYKIRALLDNDLRLRTACDFTVASDSITADRPQSFELPGRSELENDLKVAIPKCKSMFAGNDGVTEVTYKFK
ncbi:MAG: type I-U CRISPR-associated RAMP protein Csb1/Cas7u [Candidatus Paceibacterota bacterium]